MRIRRSTAPCATSLHEKQQEGDALEPPANFLTAKTTPSVARPTNTILL